MLLFSPGIGLALLFIELTMLFAPFDALLVAELPPHPASRPTPRRVSEANFIVTSLAVDMLAAIVIAPVVLEILCILIIARLNADHGAAVPNAFVI